MENEKCSRQAVYSAVAAILVSFVVFVFIFGNIHWDVLKCHPVYIIIKDNGSLIGGILAIIGVFLMIQNQDKNTRESLEKQSETTRLMIENQNKTTRKMIDSNMEVMKSEAFEIKRSGALDCAASIRADIHSLTRFALVNKKLDCSELSEQKIYRILKSSYQLNTFLGENLEDQKSLVNLIIEYTNLYMAVCMDDNVNMQNLPSIVIARMHTVGRHLNALNIRICIDDLIYDSLECFFSDYSQSYGTEGAIAITKYLQIYIDAKVAPEISQRISDKLL